MTPRTLISIATIGAVAASGIALGAIAIESLPVLTVAGVIALGSGLFAFPIKLVNGPKEASLPVPQAGVAERIR